MRNPGRRSLFASLFGIVAAGSADGQSREEIRDAQSALIGTMQEKGGVVEARDRTGRLVGTYYGRSRETRDEQGKLVSYGNTLAALLMCSGQVGKTG